MRAMCPSLAKGNLRREQAPVKLCRRRIFLL
jgi:hypothetical protein